MPGTTTSGRLRRVLWIVFTCVLLPMVMVVLAVRYDPELSPLDEVAHLDYLDRARDGGYPVMGEVISSEIATLAKCRQLETTQQRAICEEDDLTVRPRDVVPDGYSYEAQHAPPYYWLSAALVEFTSIGPADNLLTAGRLTGAFWLSAGLLLLYAALRRLRVSPLVAGLVCGLLTAGPGVVFSASKIGNDATAILGGALPLLTYTFVREKPRRGTVALLCAAVVVVVTLKGVNAVAVGAIALAALVELRQRFGWKPALAVAGASSLVGLGAMAVWRAIMVSQATVEPGTVLGSLLDFKQKSDGPPIGQFVLSLSRLLPAFSEGGIVAGEAAKAVAVLGTFAIVGVAAMAAIRVREQTPTWIGPAALLVTMVSGAMFNIEFWLEHELKGGPASRYGLSLLPLLVVPLAMEGDRSVRSKVGLGILTTFLLTTTVIGVVMT